MGFGNFSYGAGPGEGTDQIPIGFSSGTTRVPEGYSWNDLTWKNSLSQQSSTGNSALDLMKDYAVSTGSSAAYENYMNNLYNTEMSNSAVQRAVADIKAAGLNPWLAVQGSSASSPTTSAMTYSQEKINQGNLDNSLKQNTIGNIFKAITTALLIFKVFGF